MSLAKIQEPPERGVILLTGTPGVGKSTLCYQMVLSSVATERPVIFVTTERSPTDVLALLIERGMSETDRLNFVDAFTETVGLTCTQHSDMVCANCADLNSLSIAATKLQDKIGQKGILLAFDSLTSPYLFCGAEIIRFMRLFLSKFAAEGNSVVALIDEGCGKEEDLKAMMSIADGILKIEISDDTRIINVMKHPNISPSKIEIPTEHDRVELKSVEIPFTEMDPNYAKQFLQSEVGKNKSALRKQVGDFVNLFWPQFAHWSGMLWDVKRFPTMMYNLNKEDGMRGVEFMRLFGPWYIRLMFKFEKLLTAIRVLPKDLSKVKDMKRMRNNFISSPRDEGSAIIEYLDDVSHIDEHYFRVYENADCWGFENVGSPMALHLPAEMAGWCKMGEGKGRNWNAVETKCIGLGDPYCEFKLVPGEINELYNSLEKDNATVEKIHERLMERLMGFLLHEKPLAERQKLGSNVHLHPVMHAFGFPNVAGERYRMALRLGGARSGKKVGERLMEAGLNEDEAIKRVINFMEYCKVGKITAGNSIKIIENCEPLETELSINKNKEPSCFFTTGFLNGLFLAVKNQHVREVRCIAVGDPYCEWEIV